jgi:polar amino acid transport system ATP-binding protein
MFKVETLTKKVQEKVILNHISFEIDPGSIAIFLGSSGVGKSTLLRVLNNLESYDQGSFYLNGHSLKLPQVNKDHTVGMVFQQFNLFEHLTVEENITLALKKLKGKTSNEATQIASQLLESYGLGDKANLSIHKLSGGQKQRLALARTMALNPKIICLDEPTSALDPLLTQQIAKYITDLAAEGRIVIIATHDTKLIHHLNGMLYLMKEGSIIEKSHTEDYRAAPSDFPYLKEFLCRHPLI